MDKILMDNRGKGNKILTFVHSCTKFSIAYVDKKKMDSHVEFRIISEIFLKNFKTEFTNMLS